jgi:hypothetical protein
MKREKDNTQGVRFEVVFEGRKQIPPEQKKLIEELRELYQILFDARYSYEGWWICIAGEWRKKNWLLYLCYPDFFQYSAYSYLANMIVSLFKLYDSDSLNIPNVVNRAAQMNLISKEYIKEIRAEKKNAMAIWKKICVLRNNLIAHRSNRMTRNEIYKLAQVTPNQMKELTERSLRILNLVNQSLGQKAKSFDGLLTEDMEKIITLLKRHTRIKNPPPQ